MELGKDSRKQANEEISSKEYQHSTEKKIKVLMVEDNDDNRLLVSKYSNKLEHIHLEMVDYGEVCLDMLKRYHIMWYEWI